jgi:hypothetical protein
LHTFKPCNDYLDSKPNTGLEFPMKLSLGLTFKELQHFLNAKFFDTCQHLCVAKIIYSALNHTTTEFARQKYRVRQANFLFHMAFHIQKKEVSLPHPVY